MDERQQHGYGVGVITQNRTYLRPKDDLEPQRCVRGVLVSLRQSVLQLPAFSNSSLRPHSGYVFMSSAEGSLNGNYGNGCTQLDAL